MSISLDELVLRITALAKQGTENLYREAALLGVEIVANVKTSLAAGEGPTTRSGKLARSVASRTVAYPAEIVTTITAGGPSAPYAPDLEYGASPHEIYPKRGAALAYDDNGTPVVVRKVLHPGNKPYFFVTRQVQAMEETAKQRLRAAALRGLYGS